MICTLNIGLTDASKHQFLMTYCQEIHIYKPCAFTFSHLCVSVSHTNALYFILFHCLCVFFPWLITPLDIVCIIPARRRIKVDGRKRCAIVGENIEAPAAMFMAQFRSRHKAKHSRGGGTK